MLFVGPNKAPADGYAEVGRAGALVAVHEGAVKPFGIGGGDVQSAAEEVSCSDGQSHVGGADIGQGGSIPSAFFFAVGREFEETFDPRNSPKSAQKVEFGYERYAQVVHSVGGLRGIAWFDIPSRAELGVVGAGFDTPAVGDVVVEEESGVEGCAGTSRAVEVIGEIDAHTRSESEPFDLGCRSGSGEGKEQSEEDFSHGMGSLLRWSFKASSTNIKKKPQMQGASAAGGQKTFHSEHSSRKKEHLFSGRVAPVARC